MQYSRWSHELGSEAVHDDIENDDEVEMDEEDGDSKVPREAKEWKAHYQQDDMEILFDPMEDYNAEDWIDKHIKRKQDCGKGSTECINCPYCFVPLSYNYELVRVFPEGPVDAKIKRVEKYLCKKPNSVRVELTSCKQRVIGKNWKPLKLEDETYKDLTDLIFDVSCEGCETHIGEYYSSLEIYILDSVIEGNG